MKRLICVVFCLFTLSLTGLAALAATSAEAPEIVMADELELDELQRSVPSDAQQILGDLSPDDTDGLSDGLNQTARAVTSRFGGLLGEALKNIFSLLAVVVLCSIVRGLDRGTHQQHVDVTRVAGVLAIAALSFGRVGSLLEVGRQTIQQMCDFSKGLLPVLAASAAASGAPVSGAAKYVGTLIFSDLLVTLITRALVPMVYAYIACLTASAVLGDDTLTKVAGFIKWITVTVLTVFMFVFVTYLSLSGVITGNTDTVALKGLRLGISTAVPVVGGIVSDAADTVMAGASMLKSTVGLFGLFAILAIVIIPFLRVGLQYLLYKALGAVAAPLADGPMQKYIEGLGGAFALILAMTGSSCLLLLISITSTLSGGGIHT